MTFSEKEKTWLQIANPKRNGDKEVMKPLLGFEKYITTKLLYI
jgi:hypothetical protein